MNDRKERVYSEQDLCEYTILQKIDELERQLQSIKNSASILYETKEDANNSHSTLSDNIASVNSNLQSHIEENVREFRNINNTINNLNNIIPNDIGIKDNKLGLKNGNTWLTNLNAINIGDGLSYDETTNTLKASGGISVGCGISVIELTDKNGTIASAQLDKINANPQNFAFKYNGKILLFTSADSTNYQYCNNTTSSSDNNVMTESTLLTIASNTGAYTISEKVNNVVANSIHPANGGDLTNIQVGSKVYSIPSGGEGGGTTIKKRNSYFIIKAKAWNVGDTANGYVAASEFDSTATKVYPVSFSMPSKEGHPETVYGNVIVDGVVFYVKLVGKNDDSGVLPVATCIKAGTVTNGDTFYITIAGITE